MKFPVKKIYFIVFAMILGAIVIPNAAAQQFDDPDILIGDWVAYSMFSLYGSEEEIDIDLMHTVPGNEPTVVFEQDGAGSMLSFGETVPFTWEFDNEEEEIKMTIDGLEGIALVYVISENVISMVESEGSGATMIMFERISGN
jgi:hypothetical protein